MLYHLFCIFLKNNHSLTSFTLNSYPLQNNTITVSTGIILHHKSVASSTSYIYNLSIIHFTVKLLSKYKSFSCT